MVKDKLFDNAIIIRGVSERMRVKARVIIRALGIFLVFCMSIIMGRWKAMDKRRK